MCQLVFIGLPLAGLEAFSSLPLPVALPTFLVIAAVTAASCWYLYKGNSRPVMTGADEMQRAIGKLLSAAVITLPASVSASMTTRPGPITATKRVQREGRSAVIETAIQCSSL